LNNNNNNNNNLEVGKQNTYIYKNTVYFIMRNVKVLTYFLYFNIGGVESIQGPLGTAATNGLLYVPRVIVRIEKLVE
jgi:hypothetical protein